MSNFQARIRTMPIPMIAGILGNLTKQRNGETGRPWSAGAGATVTTIGLTIVDYTMSQLRLRLPNKNATLNWNDWPDHDDL